MDASSVTKMDDNGRVCRIASLPRWEGLREVVWLFEVKSDDLSTSSPSPLSSPVKGEEFFNRHGQGHPLPAKGWNPRRGGLHVRPKSIGVSRFSGTRVRVVIWPPEWHCKKNRTSMVMRIGCMLVEEDIYGKAKSPFSKINALVHFSFISCESTHHLGKKRVKKWLYGFYWRKKKSKTKSRLFRLFRFFSQHLLYKWGASII